MSRDTALTSTVTVMVSAVSSAAAAYGRGTGIMVFSLTENPFWALSVSPRAKLPEIEDAYEDRVVAAPDEEHALLLIKQKLVTPRSRLVAELGWLPDVSPQRARLILCHLGNADLGNVRLALDGLSGLAKANLAADACVRFTDPAFVRPLIEAHREIELPVTVSLLSANRAASRFPAVDDALVREGLRNLLKDHAAAALVSIVGQADPGGTLGAILVAGPRGHEPLVEEIVRQYDQWSAPHLAKIEKDIEEAVCTVTSDELSDGQTLRRLLAEWDELSQPVQLHSLASGLDEPRSLRIYRRVRDGCVELVRQQRLDLARQVVATLGKVFEELPTAKAEALNDAEVLEDLIKQESAAKWVLPLANAIEQAKADERQFIRQLESGGFKPTAGPLVTTLYAAFVEAMQGLAGTEFEDAPLNAIRSFCVDLNNDGDASGAAYILLKDAVAAAPARSPEGARLIAREVTSLRQNRDAGLLRKALDANELREAARLMDGLIAGASDAAEKAQLLALKKVVDERLQSRTRSMVGWAIAVGVLILIFVLGEMDSSSGSYDYAGADDYAVETTAEDAAVEAAEASAAAPLDDPVAETYETDANAPDSTGTASSGVVPGVFRDVPWDASEVMPPVSTTTSLTQAQLRYCHFEKRRLELVEPMLTTNAAITAANAAISDYNSRCGRYRYEGSDLAQVTSDVARSEASLMAQAEARAQEWNQ